ncbi:hypothetical protein AB1Y20_018088 [Prymnesium parvum]|uniref:Aldose 1-epimerase n=1 Tax=Prymnesium parvum TaxID=97485 RepID=A0AB34JQU2_PRYPA
MGSGEKPAGALLSRRLKWLLLALLLAAGYFLLFFDPSYDRPIILRNAAGAEAHILLTGAVIQRLLVPDRHGKLDDVVLGHDSEAAYRASPYFGAVVGRVANRIANATFELDGETYTLATNEAGMPGSLHGGRRGFDKVRWKVKARSNDFVLLEYTSPDGEEGYPGAVDLLVRYEVSPRSELVFEVSARTTKPTPINIAQHSYFNLGGHGSGGVLSHELTLHHATHVLPIDAHRVPTGELLADGPFDFLSPRPIGRRIDAVDGPGWRAGYDHAFVLHRAADAIRRGARLEPPATPRLAATLYHRATGRVMEVHTTLPALQLYTSNFLDGTIVGKGGAAYHKYAGVCLETEGFPDAVHHPHFPSVVLRPGQLFNHRTLYAFSTRAAKARSFFNSAP